MSTLFGDDDPLCDESFVYRPGADDTAVTLYCTKPLGHAPPHGNWTSDRPYKLPEMEPPPNYGQRFDGSDYVPDFDDERLTTQLARVYRATRDHEWHTILEIKERTGITMDASVAKHLRHLRYPRFGAYEVEKRRVGDPEHGVWEYRVGAKGSGPETPNHGTLEPVRVICSAGAVKAVVRADGRSLRFRTEEG